jgi:hypothetical protein
MIILDFCLLCFLIYLLYFKEKDYNNKKILNNKKFEIIEKLDINKNDNDNVNVNDNNKIYIKKYIKLNDYNVEVDRPVYSCSNYKNDKNIDFNNFDEELINNVYDKLVDDNRIQNVDYDNLTYYNSNENFYNIDNNDNYGYTDFMTYKNDLKIK